MELICRIMGHNYTGWVYLNKEHEIKQLETKIATRFCNRCGNKRPE